MYQDIEQAVKDYISKDNRNSGYFYAEYNNQYYLFPEVEYLGNYQEKTLKNLIVNKRDCITKEYINILESMCRKFSIKILFFDKNGFYAKNDTQNFAGKFSHKNSWAVTQNLYESSSLIDLYSESKIDENTVISHEVSMHAKLENIVQYEDMPKKNSSILRKKALNSTVTFTQSGPNLIGYVDLEPKYFVYRKPDMPDNITVYDKIDPEEFLSLIPKNASFKFISQGNHKTFEDVENLDNKTLEALKNAIEKLELNKNNTLIIVKNYPELVCIIPQNGESGYISFLDKKNDPLIFQKKMICPEIRNFPTEILIYPSKKKQNTPEGIIATILLNRLSSTHRSLIKSFARNNQQKFATYTDVYLRDYGAYKVLKTKDKIMKVV